MPGQSAVWGIDLGQCALKAIKLTFDSKTDRAVAVAFDYIEHPKILSQPDADPDELIRAALEKFLSRNEVADSSVYVSVPGQAGLARFVKLPPVNAKKIPEIVHFEAKQQIPFQLDDVVWDYQKIGGAEEVEEGLVLETEVAIFAIKRDMVQRHLAPFEAMGIDVEVVQLAPIALYNFAAFDHFYQGLKAANKDKPEAQDEDGPGVLVVLDMGADKTDVVITDGDKIWQRNLPIGGNHFTRALTKELKITFAKAEHLKKNATKAPDPKKLYQAMRPVFQDFSSELQRSIGYYASTHRDQTVKAILGVGNGFKLPGIQRFLQQNLQYEVERLAGYKGLDGEDVTTQPAFVENLPGFCVAYGLALQGLHQTPIQTNLLPREIQAKRLVRAKKPWSLAAASAILLGCIALFYGNWRVYHAVHAETFKQPEKQVKDATAQFNAWKNDFESAKGNFQAKKTQGEDLVGADLETKRLGWIKVLKLLNDAVPKRDPNAKDDALDVVPEVNIEKIHAVYAQDLSGWYTKFNDTQRKYMAPADQAAPPGGAGWIFTMKGHTFHGDESIFVNDSILKNLQSELLRQAGLTHAVLVYAETDRSWTPEKGSGARGQVRFAPPPSIGTSTDTVTPPTRPPVTQARGGIGPIPNPSQDALNLDAKRKSLPPDFWDYQTKSIEFAGKRIAGNADGAEGLSLARTEFEIQLVWIPAAAQDPSAAGAAAGDGMGTTPGAPPPAAPADGPAG